MAFNIFTTKGASCFGQYDDVVIIADEVDAQLKQQMLRYMEANAIGNKPDVIGLGAMSSID